MIDEFQNTYTYLHTGVTQHWNSKYRYCGPVGVPQQVGTNTYAYPLVGMWSFSCYSI